MISYFDIDVEKDENARRLLFLKKLQEHVAAVEWGIASSGCPSCGRLYDKRHPYGCDIREALTMIADLIRNPPSKG